ncbi:gas vesicle protein GvpJ [Amycolatopsis sp. NPDC023774]|uniref:gas vesicle protein GvpJ n=1 Tax=Amycolatopsis sp. NPDC023774 TaxID=3155015 RepID=UPI0033F9CDF2
MIDTILDKGPVIDAYVRVSLVGIELLTIDARIGVAGVDTYLRFAEAVNRLDISGTEEKGLPDLLEDVTSGGAKAKTRGPWGSRDKLRDILGEDEEEPVGRGRKRR